MKVAVGVRGTDAQGKEFQEETETRSINAHGALILVSARVASGSKVYLKNNRTQEEQECSVVFLGPVRGGKTEIGLEFCDPRPTFWCVAFPPEDWSPKHPEARPLIAPRPLK